MKKLYRFQYFTENSKPFLHQVRDLTIFTELSHILYKAGYLYEDSFLNYPGLIDKKSGLIEFGKNDLMILTTRPPYSDDLERRKIYRTDHIYEKQILKQIGRNYCFFHLSRQSMFLTKKLSSCLHKEFEDRASINFYMNRNKEFQSVGYRQISGYGWGPKRNWKDWKSENDLPKSCAFLIFIKAKDLLPDMLYVFGMGGEEGLIFARILRNGLWDKLGVDLNGPARFIMVEFEIQVPEQFPTNLDFVKNLNFDVILDTELKRT